jgi:D-aspartate ligase
MNRVNGKVGVVVLGSDFKALGVVRSLGRHGIPSIVIDNQPRSAWFSRYVKGRFHWKDSMDSEEFLHFLLNYGKQHRLEQWLLFPLQDEAVEFVARHSHELAQIYRLVTQDWEIVRQVCDKRLTYQIAQDIGVAYPKTCYPAHENDLRNMQIVFPAILKPANSIHFQHATRLKALLVNNYDELLSQYRIAASIISTDEIMIQELIPGDGRTQFSLAAYCKEGEVLLSMTARRTRQYPIDFGLSSCFVEAIEVPDIQEPAEKLLAAMHISGMVEVEFKYDRRDAQYKLLDINLRPWGWHTLCSACGLDFPYIQYQDVSGKPPRQIMPRYGHRWVRLITDIPAGIQEARAGIQTASNYLRSLAGKTVFSVFDWRDPLPVVGDFVTVLWRSLHSSRNQQGRGPQS